MERLGQLMKRRREVSGFTQEDLARRMNIPVRQITRWENAETKPPIDKLALWLKLLGVTYAEVEAILLENNLSLNQ